MSPAIPKIKLLSPQLISQIAAGEVIERPYSIVKELIENSLDAGATKIEVDIEKGGMRLIRVRDNGCGISKQDLPLALTPHATSKIENSSDLSAIGTLGFRGEALASVSSVARTLVISSEGEEAWLARAEGRDMQIELQRATHLKGTTVEVSDLFFNTPARRKFLRSEKTEFLYIDEMMKRLVLSFFEVEFVFSHHQKIIWHLPSAKNKEAAEKRIVKVLGKNFVEEAVYIETVANQESSLALSGWLTSKEFHRSQADMQFVFLNGRSVRDRILNHAIRQAYADIIPQGRHSAFILYLTIDPSDVDVNVHPSKTEVRFYDQRFVHDFLLSTIKNTVQSHEKHENSFSDVFHPTFQVQNSDRALYQRGKSQEQNIPKLLAIFKKKHLLIEESDSLKVVDLEQFIIEKARERFYQEIRSNDISTMRMPIPVGVTLVSEGDIEKHLEKLISLGFHFQRLSDQRFLIHQIPVVFENADLQPLFSKFFTDVFPEEVFVEKLFENFTLQNISMDQLKYFDIRKLLEKAKEIKL